MAYAFVFQEVPPLIGSIMEEFNVVRGAEAGLLMSVVVVPGIFLALPAGFIVDRYGVRFIGFVSTVLTATGSFVTATANSFTTMLLGRLIVGIGGAFIVTALPTIIPQWFPREELGKAMGFYGTNMPLATILAFPTASLLMLNYGWRYPSMWALLLQQPPLQFSHPSLGRVLSDMRSLIMELTYGDC